MRLISLLFLSFLFIGCNNGFNSKFSTFSSKALVQANELTFIYIDSEEYAKVEAGQKTIKTIASDYPQVFSNYREKVSDIHVLAKIEVLNPTAKNVIEVYASNLKVIDHYSLDLVFADSSQYELLANTHIRVSKFNARNSSQPSLLFASNNESCEFIEGEFEVLELTRNTNGSIHSVAIDFIQYCEGLMKLGDNITTGAVRINSSLPVKIN